MTPTDPDPLIGTDLAGYRIASLVGQGGMGVVYRAEAASGETVAIKVMAPEISGNPDFRERFMRESESVVDHPNVVPIYESGRSRDVLYIAMRLVDGPDLKTIIADGGRLLPARAAAIFWQAAAALDAAHENGIVHRDVKPQNILVEASGDDGEHVYLTDFGLVKRAAVQSSFTSTAYLMGSVHYMSPEHIEGKVIDGRADVYALGCVLYESLTGTVPFDKENEVAVLWSHVNEPPPPVTGKVPILASGIDAVVAKAMAKSPDDRYLTAGEFASAVATELGAPVARRSLWGSGGIRATGGRRPAPRGSRRPGTAAPQRRSRTKTLLAAALVSIVGVSSFAMADRGRKSGDGATDLAMGGERLGGSVPQGNAPQQALRASDAVEGRGTQRQRHEPDRLVSVATAGSGDLARALSKDEEGLPEPLPIVARGSPLAKTKIVFHAHYDGPGQGTPAQGESAGDLYMVDADGRNRALVTHDGPDLMNKYPAWSPCGDVAYVRDKDIWVVVPGKSDDVRLTRHEPFEWFPAWSPDCSRVLYSTGGTVVNPGPPAEPFNSSPGDVFGIRADGLGRTKLTSSAREDTAPTWSPDGKKVAFASDRDGDWDIYVMTTGGERVRSLTHNDIDDFDPAWSPDGRTIAFVRGEDPAWTCAPCDTLYEIWTMDAGGGRERRLTDNDVGDMHPAWSPDASRLLFFRNDTPDAKVPESGTLWVMRVDGSEQRPWLVVDHVERAAWQTPHFRTATIRLTDDSIAQGQLASRYHPCAALQAIQIEHKTPAGWRVVARTTTDSNGRFAVTVPRAESSYRARAPFVGLQAIMPLGAHALCAPAYSRAT